MKKSIGPATIIMPNPVLIIGSYDDNEKPNIMTVAWGGICCSNPPAVNISLRKSRYSYNGIAKRKAFTVNIPSKKYVKESDYVGIYSGKDENKFETMGLTPVKSDLVDAPYIEEFPMALMCEVINVVEIGVHDMFIGEIKDIVVDENVLDENGKPDITKIEPIAYDYPSRTYRLIGKDILPGFSQKK